MSASIGIGTLIKGFFALVDLAKRFLGFVERRQAKQEGRTEEKLAQSEATVEVLSRTNEAGNLVDQMSDEEVDKSFDKL